MNVGSGGDISQSMKRANNKVRLGSVRVVATLLSTVLIIGASILGVAYKFVDDIGTSVASNRSTVQVVPPDASLLNARRLPAILSTEIRIGGLIRSLSASLQSFPEQSCLVVSVEGQRITSIKPNLPVIPASNMKLLTAVAALEVLGPEFVYTTKVVGLSAANQVVGDLWLVGGGDPLLSTVGYPLTENYPTLHPTNIGLLIDALATAGITEITGNIVGDESRYDTERFTPSLGLGVRTTEVGPLGSLMLNDGVVLASPIKPDQPALSAAQEFLRLLNERGIVVRGTAKVGTASADLPVIASINSAPLSDVVAEMLTNSDNNTAELILKEIGLSRLSTGTRVAGTQVVQSVLQEFGLPVEGLVIVDGSGLDRGNRATCSLFTSILEKDGGFGLLGSGLAVAGQTGTLRDLLGDTAASERLRAKTGTLTGAKALSGYVVYGPEKAANFSLILNGSGVSNQGEYRPIWNGIANALGGLSDRPSVTDIAP
jgi:D-alanyl-D-alanine carboxypeptidase/D-alanyl-D-alanine-endopeptidase (penicillin-binding protein 4)